MLWDKRTKVCKHGNSKPRFLELVLIAGLFFFSCASQTTTSYAYENGVPSKFLNPYEIYAKDVYVAAVGVGDTLELARSAALSALSQQIEVSVKTTQQTEESFLMSSAHGFSENSALVGNTNVRSVGNFVGVQYGESFQGKNKRIYTIAYIHRVSAGNAYKGRIDETSKALYELLEDVDKKQGLEKFAILLRAIGLSVKNDAMFAQLDGISPPIARLARKNRKYTTLLLKNQLRNAAYGIVFAVPVKVTLLYDAESESNTHQIQRQIKTSIMQMLTSLQFRVAASNATHVLETNINIGKQSGKYIQLLWDLTFSIKDDVGTVLLSKTQRGNAQGLDMTAARRFAVSDMQKIITTLFADYMSSGFVNE